MPKTSEATRKAIAKYQTEKVEELKIRVPKGRKAVIQEFAKKQGKSVNALIIELLNEAMQKSTES